MKEHFVVFALIEMPFWSWISIDLIFYARARERLHSWKGMHMFSWSCFFYFLQHCFSFDLAPLSKLHEVWSGSGSNADARSSGFLPPLIFFMTTVLFLSFLLSRRPVELSAKVFPFSSNSFPSSSSSSSSSSTIIEWRCYSIGLVKLAGKTPFVSGLPSMYPKYHPSSSIGIIIFLFLLMFSASSGSS